MVNLLLLYSFCFGHNYVYDATFACVLVHHPCDFSLAIITLASRSIRALLRQLRHPSPSAFVSSDPAVSAAARLLTKCKNVLTLVNTSKNVGTPVPTTLKQN